MELISLDMFLKRAMKIQGYMIASLTDQYVVDEWPSTEKIFVEESCREDLNKKLLELRIFNKQQEMKAFRSDVSKEFLFREKTDVDADDYFDEWQYLDIDSTKEVSGQKVTATGGGVYKLPLGSKVDAKICIRYYLGRYSETGQAIIQDWRCVDFKEVR